jgi:hypothetical protein
MYGPKPVPFLGKAVSGTAEAVPFQNRAAMRAFQQPGHGLPFQNNSGFLPHVTVRSISFSQGFEPV